MHTKLTSVRLPAFTFAMGCLALAAAGPAGAATMTSPGQAFALNYNSFSFGTDVTSATLNFARFDTGLGTLTGVAVNVASTTAEATAIATIIGGMPGDLVSSSVSGTLLANVGLQSVVAATVAAMQSCTVDPGPGCTNSVTQPASFSVSPPLVLASPGDDLSGFAGGGSFALSLMLDSLTFTPFLDDMSGTATGAGSGIVAWAGTASVTYTYDAGPPTTDAPEPATLALLGAALGLGGIMRRRR